MIRRFKKKVTTFRKKVDYTLSIPLSTTSCSQTSTTKVYNHDECVTNVSDSDYDCEALFPTFLMNDELMEDNNNNSESEDVLMTEELYMGMVNEFINNDLIPLDMLLSLSGRLSSLHACTISLEEEARTAFNEESLAAIQTSSQTLNSELVLTKDPPKSVIDESNMFSRELLALEGVNSKKGLEESTDSEGDGGGIIPLEMLLSLSGRLSALDEYESTLASEENTNVYPVTDISDACNAQQKVSLPSLRLDPGRNEVDDDDKNVIENPKIPNKRHRLSSSVCSMTLRHSLIQFVDNLENQSDLGNREVFEKDIGIGVMSFSKDDMDVGTVMSLTESTYSGSQTEIPKVRESDLVVSGIVIREAWHLSFALFLGIRDKLISLYGNVLHISDERNLTLAASAVEEIHSEKVEGRMDVSEHSSLSKLSSQYPLVESESICSDEEHNAEHTTGPLLFLHSLGAFACNSLSFVDEDPSTPAHRHYYKDDKPFSEPPKLSSYSGEPMPIQEGHELVSEPKHDSSDYCASERVIRKALRRSLRDPSVLVGWEVLVEDMGVGLITSISETTYHSTGFEVQFYGTELQVTLPLRLCLGMYGSAFTLLRRI